MAFLFVFFTKVQRSLFVCILGQQASLASEPPPSGSEEGRLYYAHTCQRNALIMRLVDILILFINCKVSLKPQHGYGAFLQTGKTNYGRYAHEQHYFHFTTLLQQIVRQSQNSRHSFNIDLLEYIKLNNVWATKETCTSCWPLRRKIYEMFHLRVTSRIELLLLQIDKLQWSNKTR